MFTFYLWFVFAEHPFFHRRTLVSLFVFLLASLRFGSFSNEGPRDAPLSSVRQHPVLPLGYFLQTRPSHLSLSRILCETGARLPHSP